MIFLYIYIKYFDHNSQLLSSISFSVLLIPFPPIYSFTFMLPHPTPPTFLPFLLLSEFC